MQLFLEGHCRDRNGIMRMQINASIYHQVFAHYRHYYRLMYSLVYKDDSPTAGSYRQDQLHTT